MEHGLLLEWRYLNCLEKKPATSSNDLRYTQNLKGVKEERGYTGMVGMLPRFKVSFQRGQDHQQAIQLVQMRPPGKV